MILQTNRVFIIYIIRTGTSNKPAENQLEVQRLWQEIAMDDNNPLQRSDL